MSTPSRSAISVALPCGRTLKPTMTASDAAARLTLVSVIAPTPRSMTRRLTSSPTSILDSASSRASTEPAPSPLRMRRSSCVSPFSSCSNSWSRVLRRVPAAWAAIRSRAARRSAIWRAIRSSSTTMKLSPAPGTAVRPSTWTGNDGGASVDVVAVVVEQRPDPAVAGAGHDRVADVQRAALDQDGGDRATTLVQVGLDGHTLAVHLRVGPQVERRVGGQDDRLEQLVQTLTGDRGDVDEHGVAAVLLRHQAVLGELAAHLGRVRALAVDLVDRHHDRDLGRQGVVERLDGLRHHAVVGRHHQHGDVGRLRAAGTHGGERLVTRGVDEGDLALVAVDLGGHLVGADGLGDATGLAGDHVGLADRVEQLGLAVVDVTHDGDHRRTRREIVLAALVLTELDVEALQQLAVLVLGRDDLDLVVELGRRAPAACPRTPSAWRSPSRPG